RRDRHERRTRRVHPGPHHRDDHGLPTGLSPNGVSQRPVVSADGRLVIFRSEATNLVAGDTNAVFDLFRAPTP
ncbi:MAG: hypothetical protein AAF368_00570, partial [Planctomycetota bacterium]